MSFSEEYAKLRKKRLEEEEEKVDSKTSFAEEYAALRRQRLREEEKSSSSLSSDEIAKSILKNPSSLWDTLREDISAKKEKENALLEDQQQLFENTKAQLLSDMETYRNASDKQKEALKPYLKQKYGDILQLNGEVEEDAYFTSGLLSDGYDYGDISRTIIGTAKDASNNFWSGALETPENLIDAALIGVGHVSDFFGNHSYAETLYKASGKDLYDAKSMLEAPSIRDQLLKEVGAEPENYTDYSILGGKTNSLLQSGGQMAAASALQAVGVPWELTMGASSYSQEFNNAKANGATTGEAAFSAAVSAGAEILTEKLFKIPGLEISGQGKLGTSIADKLAKKFSSTAAKNLLNWGVNLVGEGAEETVTDFFQRLGQVLSYEREETLEELVNSEDARNKYLSQVKEKLFGEEALESYKDSFIGGAAMSAVGGLPTTISATKAGVDLTSGLSKNEQAVVDKLFDQEVAERQKSETLSQKDKAKIYEGIIEKLEKGQLSTDDIEAVLGGEDYKAYKDILDKETALEDKKKALQEEQMRLREERQKLAEEYTPLNNKAWNERSGEEYDRMDEIDQRIEEIKNRNTEIKTELKDIDSKLNDETAQGQKKSQKAQLSQKVYEMSKSDRLVESYLENVRKTQKFEADLSKYSKTQKAFVQKAMDSGVLNNSSTTHELVDLMANIHEQKGVDFDFTNNEKLKESGFSLEGAEINGFVNGKNVTVNVNAKKALNSVVGHEVAHVLEGSQMYDALAEVVETYAKTKGEYDARLAQIKNLYTGKEGYTGTDADAKFRKEVVADLVGDYIFTDKAFVQNLSTNRNVFQKIYDEIKYLYNVATAGSEQKRQLEKAKKIFAQVWRDTKNTTAEGGTKYSLNKDAATELHKALYDTRYRNEVRLRDETPAIMLAQKGVKNLPMAMNASHIRENVFTEDEARSLGLRVDDDTHYHGLGEEFFLKVIDGLDNVKEAYRGTKNATDPNRGEDYFLLVSEFTDDAGNTVNVPVYINEHAQFNRVFVDVNKISTVFGRENFRDYINRQIQQKNLVRIKNRSTQASERNELISLGYGEDASFEANVPQETPGVNPQNAPTEQQNEKGLNREQELIFSLSNDTKYADAGIALNKSNGYVAEEVMEAQKLMRERVANRLREMSEKGVALPEDMEGKTDIANSSYDVTEENTTICPRSLSSEAFVDAVSEYIGRPLTVEEQIYISQDLQGRSMTPECTYCYVATDRKAYRAFLGEYVKQRDAVIEELKIAPNADTSRSGELYKEFLNGRKDTSPMYNRFKMWVDAYQNGTPMIDASHLANMSKLMGDLNEFGAELKPQIEDAMKYAQSASWAKKRVNYVAYNGHILKWKQDRINKLNSHYGLRMYSFSDFHPAFVLENMQMISDASVRGLKMLGYTKDIDFVEIFAPSGMNINVSTFGFESGGNVYENNIIGAEWEKAKALREQYPNVGITFVATNDATVNWALDQDWIDVVIPYHLVRTGAEVAKAFNYTNYTSESSDVKDAEWKKGDKKYIAPTEHNNDKATYLEALAKNHLKPRFERFLDNPNYMKLVNECRQSASESQPVQPKFNEEAIDRTLARLEANGYYQPIGGSVERMYEIAAEVAEDMTQKLAPTMSLSETGTEDIAPIGWNVRGEDVAFDAPMATTSEAVEGSVSEEISGEEIAPLNAETVVAAAEEVPAAEMKPPVAKPARQPGKSEKERKWYGTSTASEAVDGAVTPDDIPDEVRYYQPIPNKKTLGNANDMLELHGYDQSLSDFKSKMRDNKVSLDDIALGERLIQEAVKKGDTKTATDLIMDISILGTELGQKVQALSIIKRLTPEGQLKMLTKAVERGKTKGDKAYKGVEITEEDAKIITDVYKEDGSFDQKELTEAVETVKQRIADRMKIGAMDYVNEWRYLSMLGNPKTHIRNIVSNIAMSGTRAVKNAVARTIEGIAPIKERTKTWKQATDFVKDYAKQATMEEYSAAKDGKYSDDMSLKSKRKVLKGVVGKAADINSALLSWEDKVFSQSAYRSSLQEYLTANGIKTEADLQSNPQLVAKAKAYAMQQAKEATFQQDSYIASKISEIERKNPLFNIAIGSTLPFKKTPINIAKTAAAYSPLGFARNIYDAVQVAKGEMDASTAVDHLAQTLTGSSLALIGYFLAQAGILNGAGDDDKEGNYDYQLGKQSYSLNFNGDTYSLSWLSPVAMPLFVGANAYEQLVEGKEWNGDVVVETLAQTLDPMSEMSFLSSLDSVLSSYDSGIQKFVGIFETAAQSYVGQFIPTLSSQVAAATDDTKRSTKASADSGFKFGDSLMNQIKYKIPGLRQTLEPTTDVWGNEVKQTEDDGIRMIESFFAPWSKRNGIGTTVDEEIKELYSQTGDTGLIPTIPNSYLNYGGEKYNMSAEDYTQYKKLYGQTAYGLLDTLFEMDTYQNASAEERADMVNKVYDYAREEAKREYFEKQGVDYTNATKDGEKYYKEEPIKGAIDMDTALDEYKFFVDSPGKYSVAVAVGGYEKYTGYKDSLNDIKSDKDKNGDSISGSRKKKVVEYINSLDASFGEKIILFKSEYPADDRYNRQIVEYLNSREDLSAEDIRTILTELDFTVDEEGYVTWD